MQNKLFLLLSLSLILSFSASAQLSIPEVEAVYGGRINAITGFSKTADTSLIFCATESANSAFFAEVNTAGTATFGQFQVMPALDAAAGFGSSIQHIGAVEHTGSFLFAAQGASQGLFYTNPPYTSISPIYTSGMVSHFIVADSTVFWINANQMFWGKFDATGNYSSSSFAPITIPAGGMVQIAIHPITGIVYIFDIGAKTLAKSSVAFNAFNNLTVFVNISLSAVSTVADWQTLGIAPDGRIFLGGRANAGSPNNKWIAYTDNEVSWTSYNSGINGTNGSNFSFMGNITNYSVGYGSMYSNNKGITGTWNNFGNMGFETHPNDGGCFTDPINSDIVYLTTDQGIGVSVNKGPNIFEINDGVEAVQVQDFDMTVDKNTAWLAAKSGIRRVTNYLTSPTWTNAIFPTGDGSVYWSAELNKSHPDTVFAGNVRVYRTNNDGNSWSKVFTAENAPYNFPNVGSEVRAIEICDFGEYIVMAGYNVQGSSKGGLFYSENYGNANTWSQILLDASTTGNDVDVFDIEFALEGTDTVAYIGVEYDLTTPTGRSIYKLVKNGSSWTVSQDMNGSTTSTGASIVASIIDIEVSTTGDTIFAAGTDAGINHPICYYKPLNSTGLWTPFTTSGFPFVSGKKGKAVTIGNDTLYCAVDNEIYYYPMGAGSWTLGYSYANGTEINFLYFDDLLAGTGTGLYGHPSNGVISSNKNVQIPFTDQARMKIFPNPVFSQSIIELNMPKGGFAKLSVYNLDGKEIRNIAFGYFDAGIHQERINVKDLPKGIYFVTLTAENYRETKKLIIAR